MVVFPMLRVVKGNPVQIGESIGQYLVDNVDEVDAFNVVKGFLNVVISDAYYLDVFNIVKIKKIWICSIRYRCCNGRIFITKYK